MKHLASMACLLACLLFTVGCEKDQESITESTIVNKTDNAKARAGKINICHKGKIININANALQGHLRHGDVQIIDADGAGYVSEENECGLPVDCDDTNANVNSGQTETPYNGIDDDCNPETLDDDLDEDGFGIANDCDDNNVNINPDAEEICDDGLDNNCNGLVDCEDEACETSSLCNIPCTGCNIEYDIMNKILESPYFTSTQYGGVLPYYYIILNSFKPGTGREQAGFILAQEPGGRAPFYISIGSYFDEFGNTINLTPTIKNLEFDFDTCTELLFDFAEDNNMIYSTNPL